MKIAIGSDHRGYKQKEDIKKNIAVTWMDVGTDNEQRTDYPLYAQKVVELMMSNQVDVGVLLCGTGAGMAVAANRYKKIYAAVVWNSEVAQRVKEEDNVNLLVLPSDFISTDQALEIVERWKLATFKEGRYAERIAMIDAMHY